jgi:integral membrane protein
MTAYSLKTAFGRFKAIAIAEGISYLLLLGIAMPLKYYFGMPVAVRIAGSIHGFLFILYLVALMQAASNLKWPLTKILLAFFASVLPFAPFFVDKLLLKDK